MRVLLTGTTGQVGWELQQILSQQVEADARENLPGLVFDTVIPRNVRLSEAPSAVVRRFFEDRQGRLWLATDKGLDRYVPGSDTFVHYRHDPDDDQTLSGREVRDVIEADDGTLLVGSMGGLDRFDPTTGRATPLWATDHGRAVVSLLRGANGTLWAGLAPGGLARIDDETGEAELLHHDPNDPATITHGPIGWLHERATEPGVLWLASLGGGLDRYDTRTGAVQHYTKADGLPDHTVYTILEDHAGRLWLSTNRGVVRFEPDSGEMRTFGPDDGLAGSEFDVWSAAKGRSGELFFGGTRGLSIVDPRQVMDSQVPPQVALTDLLVSNERVNSGAGTPVGNASADREEMRLRHDQNDLTFEYAGLHYKNPQKNAYAYRLDGVDEEWVDAGTRRVATYANLPPGDYVFRVRAANADGVWNEAGAAFPLVIRPPWWRTVWAYGFYLLLLGSALFAVDRLQRRRLIERERARAMARELEDARRIEAMNAELRAHQDQVEAQNAQLVDQKRRLLELDEAKSRFFANISHEFRTPLMLILTPLEDLRSEPRKALNAHQLDSMRRSAWRLLRLINQLLDLSRLESDSMVLDAKRSNLIPFLREIVLAFSARADREHISLSMTASREDLWMQFDRDKLEKVVVNLLSNAFKFTGAHGKIRINVTLEETGEAGPQVEIAVRDTGRGIPPEALPHVFDRFYQADGSATRRDEGTGIGLALAKELVELHGGTIGVESQPGFGTTVVVRLPADAAPAPYGETAPVHGGDGEVAPSPLSLFMEAEANGEEHEEVSRTSAAEPDNRPRVLVVEDNPDVLAYLRTRLDPHYEVAEATNGSEGLARARELHPALVISDVMMPGVDGIALCQALKSDDDLNHIPVILLTAKADDEARLAGLASGADDYLTKPFNAEELLVRVENLIEIRRALRHRYSSEMYVGPTEISVPSEEAEFLEQVRGVAERNLAESSFTVEQLADEVGMSTRQLYRRMKEGVGMTPGGYLRMLRLKRAGQLLAQRQGAVSEVAYAVGFNDANYFSRLFKQTFGVPPSEYTTDRS